MSEFTRIDAITELTEHLNHWKRLLKEHICEQEEGEKTIKSLEIAIESLKIDETYQLEYEKGTEMLRQTNYGAWVLDDGRPNVNEIAVEYIRECAEMVGLKTIYGKTAYDMTFMAEIMRRMREGYVNPEIEGEISGDAVQDIFRQMHKEYEVVEKPKHDISKVNKFFLDREELKE